MAELSTSAINDLPDSAFAHIEPGGTKDGSGKTVPRSLRHFPIHDAAHTRNALARAPQSPFGDKAMPKILAAAKKFGIQTDSDGGGGRSWEASTMGDFERRFTPGPVELRTATEGQRIGGYASVFNKLSRNLGGFVELVQPTAFNQARMLHWPGVACRYNHDSSMLLGTTAGRTLDLRVDPDMGLWYDVLPPQSRADILELVTRGDIQHSSFAFRVPPGGDDWSMTEQNYPMRSLREVSLVDVAPVLEPAYTDATAGLRSQQDGVAAAVLDVSAALRSLALKMDADIEEVRSLAKEDELRRFFIRTDRTSGLPAAKVVKSRRPIKGAAAMMALMAKREPDLD